jgi:hypothetical protein
MAAVTAPGYPHAAPPQPPGPPEPDRPRRRPWLIAIVVCWILAVVALGLWSVRRDPPTVPEQRDLATALPILERATGALLAAATGDGRAVVLGPLQLSRDCRLTPVWAGVEAIRDITLYVPAGRALPVLEQVAAALPAGYRAEAGASSGGRRVGLQADAGGFVAIDAAADAQAQVLTLRAYTGCRPAGDAATTEPAEQQATTAPAALRAALEALSAPSTPARVREVTCPGGGVARAYTVDGVPAPRDLGRSLMPAVRGATVVRAESAAWAYRTGGDSVVITRVDAALRVTVTTACT